MTIDEFLETKFVTKGETDAALLGHMHEYLSGCAVTDEDEDGSKYWSVEDLESALADFESE